MLCTAMAYPQSALMLYDSTSVHPIQNYHAATANYAVRIHHDFLRLGLQRAA